MENKKTTKQLAEELSERIREQITTAREDHSRSTRAGCRSLYLGYTAAAFLPLDGYKLKELKNNKPLTLLKAKAEAGAGFVCFVALRSYTTGESCFTCFDLNQNKKTTAARIKLQYMGGGWGDPRKDGERIGIITNKNIYIYFENIRKHTQRVKNYNSFTDFDRFNYTDHDFRRFENIADDFGLTLWGFSYNSLADARWDALSCDHITIKGQRVPHNCKTRKELYNFMFDKCGYFILLNKITLKERADQLRKQKEAEKARQAREEWQQADKSEYIKQLEALAETLRPVFASVASCGAYDFYTLHRLQDIGEVLHEIQKAIQYINKYRNANECAEDIKRLARLVKKAQLLAPLAGDAAAYGFSWWDLNDSGELVNTYPAKDRYMKISADGIGTF